jgi:peroxiredoxin
MVRRIRNVALLIVSGWLAAAPGGVAAGISSQEAGRLVVAQAPPGAPAFAAPPTPQRLGGKPEGLTREVETLVRKLVEAYQKAESYRDRGRVKLVQQSGRVKTTTEMPMELAFQRPNQVLLDSGQYTVASDGNQLYFIVPELRQYTAAKAPARLEKRHLQAGSVLGGADEGHPELIDFLVRPDAYDLLLGQVTKIGLNPDATVEGVPCRVLVYETLLGTRLTNYIDAKRMLLLRIEAETPADPQAPSASMAVAPQPATRLLYEIAPVDLNVPIDPAVFAFKPPPRYRRVAQIGAPGDPFSQGSAGPGAATPGLEAGHLLGKPAPALEGQDLSGRALATAELRGKVVLLFFWSLGGSQYSLTSIPVVQQVADHFKSRPEVVVLGIGGDADQPQVVRQVMERKQARFRTLLDEEMKLQRAFQLAGLPTFVVIGADGLVKWAKLGAPPTLKQDLIDEIEKRLPK